MSHDESKQIEKIGYNIAHYRRLRHVSQEELAEKAGISVSTLGNIETSTRFPNPTILILIRIAKTLDVELCDLFNFNPDI
jgi:transcriptional regulator with XRE-family HTH domain